MNTALNSKPAEGESVSSHRRTPSAELAQIAAIRLGHGESDRPSVVSLGHRGYDASDGDRDCSNASEARWELIEVVEVVGVDAAERSACAPEVHHFQRQDDSEEGRPVTQETCKIADDLAADQGVRKGKNSRMD